MIFLSGLAMAQPVGSPLKFDVASIKPADPDARGSSIMTNRGAGLNVTNMSLRAIITFAWNIRDFQLSGGPGWIGAERYDIIAKAEGGETPGEKRSVLDEQLRERLRSLLSERFGFLAHYETRDEIVYTLSVAKSGSKLTAVTVPGNRQGISTPGPGRAQGFAATMKMLLVTLSDATSRPVLDKTGLTGMYDFVLEWIPDMANADPEGSPQPRVTAGSTIFTALQDQLGLKLESGKGPVDIVVIDRAERPSAN